VTFQACAFRKNDESLTKNKGNFIEQLKLLTSYNDKVASVELENALQIYSFPKIQKEILQIIASKVQNGIRKEVSNVEFYILIDEIQNKSKRDQITIILRFANMMSSSESFFFIINISKIPWN